MKACKYEISRERIHAARLANEVRHWNRMDRLETEAEEKIGQLCRDGKTVHYINLRNGKTKEGSKFDLINYLIRNKYV